MVKVNRNAVCPCGSGKKYKRCCLSRDRETLVHRLDPTAPTARSPFPRFFAVEDDIDRLSNSVLDLIKEGRLDEAEAACRQLQREFPDAIDWIERTGAVHEARGEIDRALEYYRRCLQYIDDHPDYFEEASKDWYRESIKRLVSNTELPSASKPEA